MAKKKKTKKRVISKTEKKLKNQRRYQVSKRNEQRKKLNSAVQKLEKLKPKKVGKTEIYEIPAQIKKELGIKRKVYKASKQTIINEYYKKIYKINNVVDDIEQKLTNRFKFKQKGAKSAPKRKKDELEFEIGFVWNVDENVPKVIFLNDLVLSVEGYNKKTQAPEILDLIQEEKSKMDSKHFMWIVGKMKADYRIFIENLEETPKKFKKLRTNYAS